MNTKIFLAMILSLCLLAIPASAWLDDWHYRIPISCSNLTTGTTRVINGTGGVFVNGSGQIIWTNCRPDLFLYYNSSSQYAVGDESTAYPFEVAEGNGTSYNPESVWSNHYEAWHLTDVGGKLIDSVDNSRSLVERGSRNTTSEIGFIGQGRGFSETADNGLHYGLEPNKSIPMNATSEWTLIYFVKANDTSGSYMQTISLGNLEESGLYPNNFAWVAYHHSQNFNHFTTELDQDTSLDFDANPHILFFTKLQNGSYALFANDTTTSVSQYGIQSGGVSPAFTYSNITIGSNPDLNWGWRGIIDEVLIVKDNLNTTEMGDVLKNYQGTEGYASAGAPEEYTCPTNWTCTLWGFCNSSDQARCIDVVDNNNCGLNYTGNYSEFGSNQCDFCTPDFFCSDSSGYCQYTKHYRDCLEVTDRNNCYPQTNQSSDYFDGNFTAYRVTCGYSSQYNTSDVKNQVIDTAGGGLMEFMFWVRIIIVVVTIGFLIYGLARLGLDKLGIIKIKNK